ncbi:Ecto-NOX disulfide-thiol exchanger 1, partial [Ophiophagus hannah]
MDDGNENREYVSLPSAADGLGNIAIDTAQFNMSVTDPSAWATAMNNLGMVPVGLTGQQIVTAEEAPWRRSETSSKRKNQKSPVAS